MTGDIMSGLIEGLPDAVALHCLARVPFYYHQNLRLVCRSWRAALCSPEVFKARREAGTSEELLCVLAFHPENIWQLYDPCRDHWLTLPVMPSQIRHLARFGVTSVDGKLFVLGGGSDRVDPLTGDHDGIFATSEVWSYDPFYHEWSRRANMLVPRAMFACCSLDGKIVVAGGFTSFRKSISKAEIYDPDTDSWRSLPDLRHTHTSASFGVVIDGKIHVLHKGLSAVQILDDGQQWRVVDFGWLQGPMAVVRDELYVLNGGFILKQRKGSSQKEKDDNTLVDKLVSSSPEFRSRIGFGMIGLGDDLYVIGGVIGPGPTNQLIKQLRDVDVLSVNTKWPIWRQASPMTRCSGSILGCAVLKI
ncbi:F-box/kelch-repeat protein SKIP30 [Phalaenopsis equestris]|uniref:F-box/kelch-repeat protein SKIP30 n=1 Tax=Phalaenopsis equestris TaxID=78828 RepID=UPI0009E592D6|nr:F-box/kelch-repeat protein SKIP30 [Phalaenopsis equestris]